MQCSGINRFEYKPSGLISIKPSQGSRSAWTHWRGATDPEHSEAHGHTRPGMLDRRQEGQPMGQNQSGDVDWGVVSGECHILFSVSALHEVSVNGATEG